MPFPFNKVENRRPPRSVFNLSHEKKFTCDMTQLIPVLAQEMVPGDTFQVKNEIVIRMQPLVAPIMHEINAFVHYFFVPYRILWDNWEAFITGGVDGDDASVLPRYVPTNLVNVQPGTVWDYLGYPTVAALPANVPDALYPLDFKRRAYIQIYNEYYRDQNLQDPYDYSVVLQNPFRRSWEKDYFTACLPWQQRGVAPALPITGTSSAIWANDVLGDGLYGVNAGGVLQLHNLTTPNLANGASSQLINTGPQANVGNSIRPVIDNAQLNMNTVDLSSASTFDIADLRLAFQIQRWMERNARSGVRYTEFLNAHFGVHPRDDRLQRPEYIGGSKSPIIISEVLKTSSTDAESPQGNLAGHGITADRNYISSYTAQEFGVMMAIFSVMPRTAYQQGINRQDLKQSRYDFYFPEFANLSEQEVYSGEVYWDNDTNPLTGNSSIFGYQGRYDEMRYVPNTVHGLLKTDLSFWHLGRVFASRPLLNVSFTRANPEDTKRVFAATTEPGLIVSFGNIIRAVRPLPAFGTPGYMDH